MANTFFGGNAQNKRKAGLNRGMGAGSSTDPAAWDSDMRGNRGPGSVGSWMNKFGHSNLGRLQNMFDARRRAADADFREGALPRLNVAFNNAGGIGGGAHALATGKAWGTHRANLDAAEADMMWKAADAETARGYAGREADLGRQHDWRSREADRGWRSREAALGREWQTGERIGSQDWQTGERVGAQNWQTGERMGAQDWRSGEASLDRDVTREGWRHQAEMARADRDWRGSQAQQDRDWRTSERTGSQDWQRQQAIDDRTWRGDQAQQDRDWRGRHMDDDRALQALDHRLRENQFMWGRDKDVWNMGNADMDRFMQTEQGAQAREDMVALDLRNWNQMERQQQMSYLNMAMGILNGAGPTDQTLMTKAENILMNWVNTKATGSRPSADDFGG